MKCQVNRLVLASTIGLSLGVGSSTNSFASDADAIARSLQDPLANISAIITDNTFNLDMGGDEERTGYDFQIQPVHSLQTDRGFSIVPRGVIPIIGAPPESDFPGLGEPRPPGDGTTWGLGDIVVQSFIAPKTARAVKWGLGPQVSLRTRTDDRVGGPGWGGGVAGVVVASSGPWSFAGIANNLWGEDGFNTLSLMPMLYYNFESIPGAFVAYNNTIAYDWNASSGNEWTVPVGLHVGRAFALDGGYGLELSLGGYKLAARPEGAAEWQVKLGISVVLPR
jgi:hypothetical protein